MGPGPLGSPRWWFAQLFNAFNARSDLRSAFSHPFNNKWLWGAILFGVLAQVAVVELPLLQTAFGTASLDWAHWAIAAAMASAVLWVEELIKLVRRLRTPGRKAGRGGHDLPVAIVSGLSGQWRWRVGPARRAERPRGRQRG